MPPVFERIGIVGLGLIGGSIALAARDAWPATQIVAVDQPAVLEAALRMRAVDVAAESLSALAEVDVIILAAPVQQNVTLLRQLPQCVARSTIVTDTGSTKRDIVAAAGELPARFSFVAGHPLGGAAARGLEHASPGLFKNRPWLFTPPPGGEGSDAVTRLVDFARALGAIPRLIDVETHDRWLAYISHLPQLTASALMAVVGDAVGADGLALAGRGLIDTTRLASSPPAIWREIAATNADEIGPALDALIARLQELRCDLARGERLGHTFERAVEWREQTLKRS
jgi:prephenate dehydrogenase